MIIIGYQGRALASGARPLSAQNRLEDTDDWVPPTSFWFWRYDRVWELYFNKFHVMIWLLWSHFENQWISTVASGSQPCLHIRITLRNFKTSESQAHSQTNDIWLHATKMLWSTLQLSGTMFPICFMNIWNSHLWINCKTS